MYSFIRLTSLLIVGIAIYFFKGSYTIPFTAFLFCHYILAATYSSHQVKKLSQNPKYYLPIFFLICLTFFVALLFKEYVPYFIAIHIALSEVYILSPRYPQHWKPIEISLINFFRFTFNLSILFIIARGEEVFSNLLNESILLSICVLSFLGGLLLFRKIKPSLDFYLFEFTGLIALFSSLLFEFKLSTSDLVFYHILTWFIMPLIQFSKSSKPSQLKIFLAANFVVTSLLWLFILFFLQGVDLKQYVPIFATIHVLSSFSLSRLNPLFIRRVFYSIQHLELRQNF